MNNAHTNDNLINLDYLNKIVKIDKIKKQATVEAGNL
jgi:FAD/FMN-containing dehydrogenase